MNKTAKNAIAVTLAAAAIAGAYLFVKHLGDEDDRRQRESTRIMNEAENGRIELQRLVAALDAGADGGAR